MLLSRIKNPPKVSRTAKLLSYIKEFSRAARLRPIAIVACLLLEMGLLVFISHPQLHCSLSMQMVCPQRSLF